MSISMICRACGKKLKAPEDWAGRAAACPRCGTALVVSGKETGAAKEARGARSAGGGKGPIRPFVVPSLSFARFEDLVDMTAMVDVVFFLLIFFMVTAMQEVASSIAVPAPDAQKASTQDRRTIAAFEEDTEGVIVRIDQDDSIWLEGSEIPSEQELRVRLREARQSEARKLLVLGHGDAHHGAVVMVLDAGNDAGMEEVRLAVVDDEGFD